MPAVRQTNFSGGELSPRMWGRTDLPLFGRGARTMRNFFPSHQGTAVSRPGTTYVDTVKPVAWAEGEEVPTRAYRLVPFIAGDGRTYVLQFGQHFIRFHTFGGTVVDGGGLPYEVVTTYLARDLWKLRFAQVGDVLTIVGEDYSPAELRRNGHTAWTLANIDFSRPETRYCDVENPAVRTSPFAIVAASYSGIPPVVVLARAAEDATHPAREWQWMVTSIIKDSVTGATFETLGDLVSEWWDGVAGEFDDSVFPITSDGKNDNWVLYPDKKIV